ERQIPLYPEYRKRHDRYVRNSQGRDSRESWNCRWDYRGRWFQRNRRELATYMECELRLTTRDSHCFVSQFSAIETGNEDSQEVRSKRTNARLPKLARPIEF